MASPSPLQGIDEISLPHNALLKFSYGAAPNDPLYIHSGATAIKWNYTLNTQSTPTLGGEVVQVLSAMVGPITITGQTAGIKTTSSGKFRAGEIPGWSNFNGQGTAYGPNHELRDIISWFLTYMTKAGTDNLGNAFRSERAIKFEYPERGWDFYIMPTQLSGFRYDKTIVSPEWSITAEIVSNNGLDYFSGVTMTSFTDELLSTNTKLQGQIGLSAFATTSTETANPNFGQTGDFGSTNPFLNPALGTDALDTLKHMGDNFQGLVAAWSQGDFAHFGFGAMLDNNALPKNVNSVYERLFGTTLLGSLPGWTGGGGSNSAGSYSYSGSNKQDGVAVQVANAFNAKGLPPELGVAVALHESGLDPDAVQGWRYGFAPMSTNAVSGDGAVGLFQTFYKSLQSGGAGAGAGQPHVNEIKAAQAPLSLGGVPPKGYRVTDYYPADHQCFDAANWFAPYKVSSTSNDALARWALRAQGIEGHPGIYTDDGTTSGTCTSTFAADLQRARLILGQLTQSSGPSTNPFPDGWIGTQVDQGYDGDFTNKIVAPFDGTITYANAHDSGWGGGAIVIKAIHKQPALPTSSLYFAEGLAPQVSAGDSVKAGDVIAIPADSSYNVKPSPNKGVIEWGVAIDDSNAQPFAQVASNPRDMVIHFLHWAEIALGVSGPTSGWPYHPGSAT